MSIRDRVRKIQKDLRDGALTPDMVRESLAELTGLLGNCTEEYRDAELAFNPVRLACLKAGGAANRAEIEAKCSPEYVRLREAQDYMKMTQQSIVTCRAYLRSLDEEMRLSR